ncbi:MAG: hypothetical protein MK008_08310 [Bdellovibrionales bacterium]|nr:hypothetical protein [Bdellovibrionales bacterium]
MKNKANKREQVFQSILKDLAGCFGSGMRKVWHERKTQWINLLCFLGLTFGLTYNHRFLQSPILQLYDAFPSLIYDLLLAIPWPVWHFVIFIIGGSCIVLVMGSRDYKAKKSYQDKIERVGLKGGDGSFLRVVNVIKPDAFRTNVIIKSVGIGVEKYKSKKDDLESSFAEEIDSVLQGPTPQIIVLKLTKRKLPKITPFSEVESALSRPHSFLVGESMNGPMTRTLESLPHMLIAGTTGGGKSVFFKQALLGLLKTTPHLQLYLIDLKRGVEMKEFGGIPNVSIAKKEEEAVSILKKIKTEMDRRFEYMEENGINEIIPHRDKMDKIVVGIDEASVIYTKSRSNQSTITVARELTDELAKLARSAGIHLILATQKVSKETIDTKVQENIGGRMCFKMNTMTNSVTVLGNKMAYELPDIPGRAIWASGNSFTEVQAPLMNVDELKSELAEIAAEYERKERKLYGNMLALNAQKASDRGRVPE